MRLLAPLLAFGLLLAGCVSPGASVEPASDRPDLPEGRSAVVIAVIDTGINLYHKEYALLPAEGEAAAPVGPAPELLAGLGVPELVPVALSTGLDWADAVAQDKETLLAMEPETLYTFPGTRVLAAISFQSSGGQRCTGGLIGQAQGTSTCEDWPLILDMPGGHGTMTTSRAIGNTVSIGGAERDIHLVVVQGFTPDALRWVADQDWIDMASLSAGLSPYGIVPGVPLVLDQAGMSEAIEAFNYLSHRKPFFASTGNGFGNAGTLGFPSWARGSSGVPDALSVGANDNARMSQWHNQDPYVSADGCANPSADSDDTESVSNYGGGTSSATPFTAGGGAKLLLEARRLLGDTQVGPRVDESLKAEGWSSGRAEDATIVLAKGEAGLVPEGPLADGVLTLLEFKQLIYLTALATPTADESDGDECLIVMAGGFPGGENLPAAARFPIHGYGEVNHASIDAAIAVLKGEAPMPERGEDDVQYHMARERKMMTVGDEE